MPAIRLNLKKNLFCPKLYPLLTDYSHRFEGYKGSAGSGKRYFITQKIIYRCLNETIRVAVCRRYGSTIRNSCFSLFKEVLTKWKLTPYVKIRETDFNIKFPNGSEIIFFGLDEETKLLSLNNISTVFVEEVFEVPQPIFDQLNLRMRGQARDQQILFAFNPISKNSWLYDFCVNNPPASFIFSETTYLDNPFLSEEYKQSLEELKLRNPNKYRIYGLGEWGVDDSGLVFNNWEISDFNEIELSASLQNRNGVDFGYTDPSAVVCSLYDPTNKIIYIYNEFYKRGIQLDELATALTNLRIKDCYCDSAEPRSIDFLRRNGFGAKPCIKGQDSVKARIAFLQNHKLIIKPNCENVIRELENFSYLKDKDGNFTDKTTHEFSHTIDALGYAYSDIYKKQKFKTLDKAVLGL